MLKTAHGIKKRLIINVIIAFLLVYILWFVAEFLPFGGFILHPFRLAWGQKSYLVLLQNNYELRPTGGFISAFGILTIRNGIPLSFNFEDVYGTVDDHQYVEPPAPVARLLAHPTYKGHTFRDANYAPNFPDSAKEAEKFLHMTRPFQQIDGVFAVDMVFLENLLAAVGPIEIDGREFNATNSFEAIENVVSDIDLHDLNALGQRKMIMKNLAKRLFLKIALPWNTPGFFRAVSESLEQKHVLVYFKDDILQKAVVRRNWGGEMNLEPGQDFLAVVDANYGGAKSNRYVKRSIFYNVDLESGSARLDVRFDQPNAYSMPFSADYKSYLRVYVPQTHTVQGGEYNGAENGFNYTGSVVSVPIKSSRTPQFIFKFPVSVFDRLTYRLNLWKQPGTFDDYYQVNVRVPAGFHIKSDDFTVNENIAVFRGFLDRDKAIVFDLEKDTLAPRAIRQTLRRLNVLEIDWNEPIDSSSVVFEDWEIKDADSKNKETDSVFIESVELRGTSLYIKTRGMTNQPEESYVLKISNISDFSGNKIGEKTYTFYQRLE